MTAEEVLGKRYRLGDVIGRGGMGEVFVAVDLELRREVAVKRLRREPTERTVARFEREARVQSRLDHPAIPPVYQLGVDDRGQPYFAMKRLAGVTMGSIIESGFARTQRQTLLRAFVDVCHAVELAHTRGVVHRDLKPDNVMLGDFGEVYVLDWGVAKVAGVGDVLPPTTSELPVEEANVTQAGFTVGTPQYMAPEQARALADLDARADVFSLGCVLFEILAGEPLFPRKGAAPADLPYGSPAARAPTQEVPPELDSLVVHAVALDRDARLGSARELGEVVQRFLDGDRDLAQRRALASEHLARARAAFDGDDRRVAMRDATAALALDPQLAGAAELVGRLMLEPPKEMPKEVAEGIESDQLAILAQNARTASWGYLGYAWLTPALWWLGRTTDALWCLGAVVLNMAVMFYQGYVSTKPRPVRVLVANSLLVMTIAHVFGPFLIAPGIAALTGMMIVFAPAYRQTKAVVALTGAMILALLLPWLGAELGWLDRTMHASVEGLRLTSPGLLLPPPWAYVVLSLFVVALVIASVVMSATMRKVERGLRQQLHLQAWQLRQLMPA